MDILLVTSELAPWTPELKLTAAALSQADGAHGEPTDGGFVARLCANANPASNLAEFTSQLSRALRILGHRVTILMPRYAGFEEQAGLLLARRLTPLKITTQSGAEESFVMYDGRLSSQVELILLERGGSPEAGLVQENSIEAHAYAAAAAALVAQRADPKAVVHGVGPIGAVLELHGEPKSAVVTGSATSAAVDTTVWSPSIDTALPARYDAEAQAGKARCKGIVAREYGIESDVSVPLTLVLYGPSDVAAARRMIEDTMLSTDANIVACGPELGLAEGELVKQRVKQVVALEGPAFHRVLAAADVVMLYGKAAALVPYVQRYGSLPVAQSGIVDCDAELTTGTGFLFDDHGSAAALRAIGTVVSAKLASKREGLQRRLMRLDLGWERIAVRIARKYEAALRAKEQVAEEETVSSAV
jgi:glycogen synthase